MVPPAPAEVRNELFDTLDREGFKERIPTEARAIVERVRARFVAMQDEHPEWDGAALMQGFEKNPEADVVFSGSDNVRFFVVPGVIQTEEKPRNLVIAFIDWVKATQEELAALGHYHVGKEFAEVWPLEGNGLIWRDRDRETQHHMAEDGVRTMPNASQDDYTAAVAIRENTTAFAGMPKFYLGAYYGRISKKDPLAPSA